MTDDEQAAATGMKKKGWFTERLADFNPVSSTFTFKILLNETKHLACLGLLTEVLDLYPKLIIQVSYIGKSQNVVEIATSVSNN